MAAICSNFIFQRAVKAWIIGNCIDFSIYVFNWDNFYHKESFRERENFKGESFSSHHLEWKITINNIFKNLIHTVWIQRIIYCKMLHWLIILQCTSLNLRVNIPNENFSTKFYNVNLISLFVYHDKVLIINVKFVQKHWILFCTSYWNQNLLCDLHKLCIIHFLMV